LPLSICVLDLEGVKFSFSHHPGEAKAMRCGLLYRQLSQVWQSPWRDWALVISMAAGSKRQVEMSDWSVTQ
jgi:hypothetical protein